MRSLICCISVLALSACASQAPVRPTLVEATPASPATPTPVPAPVMAIPYAQPVPGQAKPYEVVEPTDQEREAARPAHEVIDEANQKASQTPAPEGYFNAIQTYDFMSGALYQVYGAPNHLTMITFAPGEELYSYAAGDTVRWIVGETFSGTGAARRAHLLVQPVRKSLHTTMIVTSNLGTYQFELKSYQHSYMAGVQFRYPTLALKTLVQEHQAQQQQAKSEQVEAQGSLNVALERIEDRYHLVVEDKDDAPRWTPKRVFHDGERTFIEFPHDLGHQERPTLFVLSKKKKPRLVQYTIQGRYYIVPGIMELALLKLGKGDEGEQVGIELEGKR